ncbi:MAG: hypothetical protein F7C34_01470 [Desulfurococcales archaeon]|nr:hypothetical protein [Desulfurococcales archaeon]
MELGLALLPLVTVILPFLFVYSSAAIYRSVYPENRIREAINIVADYRRLKAEAEKSKRKRKKLLAVEPTYRSARSTLLRATLLKTLLLMISYVAGSLMLMSLIPGLASPYYIPGIVITEGSTCVIASIIVYFLAYLLFYAAYRDNFL